MRAVRVFGRGVVLAVLLCFPLSAWAADFTADMIHDFEGQSARNGTISVKDRLMRMEMVGEEGRIVTIHRPDRNLIWMVMPEERMYMETGYSPDPALEGWTREKEQKAKFLGTETVSGLTCKKYEIVEEGRKVTYWMADDIGFPVKVKTGEGTMRLENIRKGNVPSSLFEPPAGFQKMIMPQIPGGMMMPLK
jgi:hypothetical protein